MKVAIIGGSGFIGTRLIRRLKARGDVEVSIVDKAPSATYPDLVRIADVRDVDALSRCIEQGAIIINLAAEHRDDVTPKSLYHDVNVTGASNVCEAASRNGCTSILFTSSVAVYGSAEIGTGEDGAIRPFNEYGQSKFDAEEVYRKWQSNAPEARSLTVVRPTVVFGEQNRGNVYNLLTQINSGRFVMVGPGTNRKSLAYVENVAAFLEARLGDPAGSRIYNYIDKPDFTMNELVALVGDTLGRRHPSWLRIPRAAGMAIGLGFDAVAKATSRKFAVSAIRIKKFCLDSVYGTAVPSTGFTPPVPLEDAIRATLVHEFLQERRIDDPVFYTE